MASIISGYEYDVFISYRHNDNRSGWVTEFVAALEEELAATLKEPVSVYFDTNPHDGLLETHSVDKSIEGKLKCLIFIPIISQTYCDSKSFAWQYEFTAFNKMAKEDQFGRDIRLTSGNFASRILPVKIHDLDPEDKTLLENELGGVLRSIDFIYKASGVNRSLKPKDERTENLNRTFYPDQINKVANAVKEIILGLKAEKFEPLKEKNLYTDPSKEVRKVEKLEVKEKPAKTSKHSLLSGVVITAIFIILALMAFPKVFHSSKNKVAKDPDGRISIAVTVFDNNTTDTTLNWLKKGIPELLRNNLAYSKELSVQNSQTMYELYESMGQTQDASVAPSLSKEAAIKLKTGTYITGSFQMFGNSILTYVKLIDTKSDELLWTGNIEGNLDKYKYLADSLSTQLKDFLEIKVIKQKTSQEYNDVNTNSPGALKKYVEGMQLLINGNFRSAAQCFVESYTLDTTFTLAAHYAALVYSYDYNFIPVVKWSKIAYRGKKRLPYYYQLWIESARACSITTNCDSVLYYNDLLAQSDIKSRLFWLDIGYNYLSLEQNQKAVKAFEKVETISSEWGGDWKFRNYYIYFGDACHKAGLHEKEALVYNTGLKLFPDDDSLIYSQAKCAISKGDTAQETKLLTKLFKLSRDAKISESDIEESLGDMYSGANSLDKAELNYRNALKSDHNNYQKMNSLSFFLIHYDRNVDEADSLSKKVLKIVPGNLTAIRVQGLVCYKHGKYEEALNFMQLAYAKNIVWAPTIFNDVKMIKKAIANQK